MLRVGWLVGWLTFGSPAGRQSGGTINIAVALRAPDRGFAQRTLFTAHMHLSAYARFWDRMSSVCLSVRLSVCDVGDL